LRFLPEIAGAPSGILLYCERRRFGRLVQRADGKACGNCAGRQNP
jgi:hypothetical protein